MLKAVVHPEAAASPPRPPPPPVLTALADDSSTDSALWLLVPENHSSLPAVAPGAGQACSGNTSPCRLLPPRSFSVPNRPAQY
ncbi:E3 ubiquitin-protein ligase RGLG1 [Dissostichus eleginoides]|uniref:E3 ubiquitin-protein ligase RGLG1 n=1 Tax=Dissostichus eleginoides TaxID=100907 RepID=A0AAD9FFX8_DISEL|nr:E3 ubiquitin-protein ligase RGLG1 [Dissostichus eleginoides]